MEPEEPKPVRQCIVFRPTDGINRQERSHDVINKEPKGCGGGEEEAGQWAWSVGDERRPVAVEEGVVVVVEIAVVVVAVVVERQTTQQRRRRFFGRCNHNNNNIDNILRLVSTAISQSTASSRWPTSSIVRSSADLGRARGSALSGGR